MVSPEIREHAIFFIRAVRRYMDMISKEKSLARIQAAVRTDFDAGIKFAEGLGFEFEGIMNKYFGEKDFFRYAKLY